jgi:hypothetical protein
MAMTQEFDEWPGWAYSRGLVDQAYEWLLLEEDPRVDAVVRRLLAVVHGDRLRRVVGDPARLRELGTTVASEDWLCQELVVFERGGLRDFLAAAADPRLIALADRVRDWSGEPLSGLVLLATVGGTVRARDLSDGSVREVLDLGALDERPPGTPVLGRLVPIDDEPGSLFATSPLSVDLQTARDVAMLSSARDAEPLFAVLEDGVARGSLREGFSLRPRPCA